ncbi:hypothetical protein M758_3G065400 [Ceratodon purpureus]|nr:hypothetical protein M758_3G065400 [Ceratodon purpureus]
MGVVGDGGLEDYVSKLDRDMPGTFFGMTSMGDSQYLRRNYRKPIYKEVHQYPEECFLKAFNQIATINGNPDCCRRANLPKIFAIAMGRELEEYELQFVLRFIDFGNPHRPGRIDINEFTCGIKHMINMGKLKCNKPNAYVIGDGKTPMPLPLENSFEKLKDSATKHHRKDLGPTAEFGKPMTGNQDIGWTQDIDPQKGARTRFKEWFGKKRSDVTFNEGVCLQNAYGIIL